MSTIETSPGDELDPVVAAATAGDESAFSELVHRYEAELHAHCYRMLRSHADSEDVRKRRSCAPGAAARASRDAPRSGSGCTGSPPTAVSPRSNDGHAGERLIGQRTSHRRRLVCSKASPRQRRGRTTTRFEGVGRAGVTRATTPTARTAGRRVPTRRARWSARDTAELLDTSLASVTSAHQRARAKLRKLLPERRLEWSTWPAVTTDRRALLGHYLSTRPSERTYSQRC